MNNAGVAWRIAMARNKKTEACTLAAGQRPQPQQVGHTCRKYYRKPDLLSPPRQSGPRGFPAAKFSSQEQAAPLFNARISWWQTGV